jgi:predicted amidohydrolase
VPGNASRIGGLLRQAAEREADVAHFPEACLSGYAGADLEGHDDLDRDLLERHASRIARQAAELGLWVVLGSAHPLSPPHKPHDSLYVIDDRGRVVDRYDKRFCSGDAEGGSGDLLHYTPGNHASVFDIRGVRCGALICHDYRYPELYRDYKERGVQLVFHSFHAAHVDAARLARMEAAVGPEHHRSAGGTTYPEITMPATMIAAAACNHVWISCPNSSARESCWGSFFVRADGVITGRLERHVEGLLLSTVDTDAELYDSTARWRGRAMRGRLHSGSLVSDPRSDDRTEL